MSSAQATPFGASHRYLGRGPEVTDRDKEGLLLSERLKKKQFYQLQLILAAAEVFDASRLAERAQSELYNLSFSAHPLLRRTVSPEPSLLFHLTYSKQKPRSGATLR